jgi:SAM-dependent methyltransferase
VTEDELRSNAEKWDARYAETAQRWSGKANPLLREVAARLGPGTALDVGCGEGGDAIWLAERGWTVVGLDLSSIALGRAAAEAVERGVDARCTWIQGDITDEALGARLGPDARFNLVSTHYVHEPGGARTTAWLAEASLTAPDGVLLIVGHHPNDEHPAGRGPRDPSLTYLPEDVTAVLASVVGLEIEEAALRERRADGPDGPLTRRDTVVVARRTS